MAIQSPPSIPTSVLQSMDDLRLGDIHFAKIQTTLRMHTMPITVIEKWAEGGSFNPEHMAEGDYSCTTAILILLNPNAEGTALESASVGLIVRWRKGPVGHISTIMKLIKYACSLMEAEGQSSEPMRRTICTIVGNYGGHMAFTTDPPFCMAYPLHFVHTDDPTQMTFRSQQNHPVSFTGDGLLVHQLLVWDCPQHEYMMDRHHGCLLIPGGMHFPPDLFPQIVVPRNHVTPYRVPKTGEDAPFVTVGPFASKDTLFHGAASNLELYTAEEVITLRNAGIFKSSNTSQSTPKLPSLASLGQALSSPLDSKPTTCSPKVEPDSSSKKRDYKNSPKSHKYPVSTAAGSCADLEKSQQKVRLCANNSTERSMLSIGKGREAGSMKTAPVPKAAPHTVCAPPTMSAAKHSSTADLLI